MNDQTIEELRMHQDALATLRQKMLRVKMALSIIDEFAVGKSHQTQAIVCDFVHAGMATDLAEQNQCACGRPLHYSDPRIQAKIEHLIARHGPDIRVQVSTRAWMVPRHYIALHGLQAQQLPSLGFPEVA